MGSLEKGGRTLGCGEVPDSRGTTRIRFLFLVFGATRDYIARSLKLSKVTGREHKKEPLEADRKHLNAHACFLS